MITAAVVIQLERTVNLVLVNQKDTLPWKRLAPPEIFLLRDPLAVLQVGICLPQNKLSSRLNFLLSILFQGTPVHTIY